MPVYDPKSKENGMIEYIEQYSPQKREKLKFVDDSILPVYRANYRNIFTEDKKMDYHLCQSIYVSLIRIKSNCARKGVKLTLVFAPTSSAILSRIESPDYWEYLRSIVMISGFYNFNGYAPYNLNPYNFVDEGHYRKEMADKMLGIIFGLEEPEDDWGILLSPENIDAYLDRRKAAYYRLKKEYEETGTIPLGQLHGPGFIPF
jgi:hypothetical protein